MFFTLNPMLIVDSTPHYFQRRSPIFLTSPVLNKLGYPNFEIYDVAMFLLGRENNFHVHCALPNLF